MFSAANRALSGFLTKAVVERRHNHALAVVLLATFELASCAVSPLGDGRPTSDTVDARKHTVETRVAARWDALIKGDFDRAYEYMSPASRDSVSLKQYKEMIRKGSFRNIKIEKIDCDAEACTVKLSLTYSFRTVEAITTPIEETWIWDQGQAWYVYRG